MVDIYVGGESVVLELKIVFITARTFLTQHISTFLS